MTGSHKNHKNHEHHAERAEAPFSCPSIRPTVVGRVPGDAGPELGVRRESG